MSDRLWPAHSYPTEAGPVELPAVWGRTTDTVLYLIEWVHRRVRKITPDERWLRERYMRRSVLEVLAEGTTFGWAPCLERTFVASSALAKNGIPHRFVMHERQVPGAGPAATHMAIELELDQGPYWIDFSRWETKFCAGTYTFRKEIERTIKVERVELPFGPALLSIRPEDLGRLIRYNGSEAELKMEWFVGDLSIIDERVLEERIIFSNAASRYERAPARARNAPARNAPARNAPAGNAPPGNQVPR
jgi:hypothetical protein